MGNTHCPAGHSHGNYTQLQITHHETRNALTSCYSCNLSSYPLPKWTGKELTSKYYYDDKEYSVCVFPGHRNNQTLNCHEKTTGRNQTRLLTAGESKRGMEPRGSGPAVAPPASPSFSNCWALCEHTPHIPQELSSFAKRNYALCHCYLLFFSVSFWLCWPTSAEFDSQEEKPMMTRNCMKKSWLEDTVNHIIYIYTHSVF